MTSTNIQLDERGEQLFGLLVVALYDHTRRGAAAAKQLVDEALQLEAEATMRLLPDPRKGVVP